MIFIAPADQKHCFDKESNSYKKTSLHYINNNKLFLGLDY